MVELAPGERKHVMCINVEDGLAPRVRAWVWLTNAGEEPARVDTITIDGERLYPIAVAE